MRRFLVGDGQAFEELLSRHGRYAGAVAFGILGDDHEPADIVQEAFIKVYHKLAALHEPERFRSWLRHIVRHTALDRLRRRRHHLSLDIESEDGDIEPLAADFSAEDVLQKRELKQEIHRRIQALPAAQREVIALKYIEGLSYDEIAAQTESTVSSVESRLHRARERLRRSFRPLR